MTLLGLYIVLAIGVSFLCSIMEAVLLSVTPGYLASLGESRPRTAVRLRRFKENIDEPLAAILSLNTIAHTVGAAGAGAQAARVFGSNWLGLFSALLTLAILFLSEIIPKTIGAVYWKQLAPAVTRLLAWIIVPLKPLVWLSALASRLISSRHNPVHVSRDEIRALADLGAQQGVLDEDESRVVEALLRFRSMTAAQVMTPRTVIFALPATDTVGQTVERHRPMRYSRIPIYRNSIDTLAGFVLKDEILERAAQGQDDLELEDLRRELFFVPGTTRLSHLLDLFLSSREHIAAVIDEFGGTAGVVTLEDLVETLLDLEIVDEVDSVEDLRAAARSEWRRRAKQLGVVTSGGQSETS
ncbi:MAG: hemolysin family protein [Holophagae bacterium]|jgi:CBS domain containing-hemolysin-like protein